MAVYHVSGPGGEVYEVTAPDSATQAQVVAFAQQQAKGAAVPKGGGILSDVGSAISGAATKLKADVANDYKTTLQEAKQPPANPFAGLGRTGQVLGDVGSLVAAPFAGAMHGAVVKPVADALDSLPAPKATHTEWHGVIPHTYVDGTMSPQQQHATNEGAVNTALMGARAPSAAPAAAAVAAKPNPFASMAQRFDAAGVTPLPVAAGGKGASTLTNVVAENPFAGAAVRGRLRNAVSQTADSASSLASRYGDARGPQITGENVQKGVQRFANDKTIAPASPTAPTGQSSFAAKSGELYDQAFSAIPNGPVTPTATAGTLKGILTRIKAPTLAGMIRNPQIEGIATALTQDAGKVNFTDLRALRSWVRLAQSNPELRQTIGQADLKNLEGALTQDIYSNATKLGGRPYAARQLQRADQYYAAGMGRIQTALQPFADAGSGESAYGRIVQAAGSTASADAQRLLSLKRSLSPDEWGDVAANAVNEMGKQTAGAAPAVEPGFSVSSFVTNYNKLSPRGKDVLFGSVGGGGQRASGLRGALDNLASVADDLKGVDKGANTSKSFVNAQALTTLGGLSNHITAVPTAVGLSGMALTGEALTNPLVVRWLARLGQASKANPGAVRVVVKQIGSAARTNAALAPLYQESMKLLAPPQHLLARSAAETQQQQPAQ